MGKMRFDLLKSRRYLIYSVDLSTLSSNVALQIGSVQKIHRFHGATVAIALEIDHQAECFSDGQVNTQ